MQVLESIKQFFNPLFDSVDEHFKDFQPVVRPANACNLRPAYFIIPFFLMAVIALGTGIFSHLFVAIFGMIYPSYMTFKALTKSDAQQCKQWLTYWIVFGFFTAFSGILRYMFFFLSVRSYNVFRVCFYLFLFHPATKGAALIYNKFLRSSLTRATEQFEQRTKGQ